MIIITENRLTKNKNIPIVLVREKLHENDKIHRALLFLRNINSLRCFHWCNVQSDGCQLLKYFLRNLTGIRAHALERVEYLGIIGQLIILSFKPRGNSNGLQPFA